MLFSHPSEHWSTSHQRPPVKHKDEDDVDHQAQDDDPLGRVDQVPIIPPDQDQGMRSNILTTAAPEGPLPRLDDQLARRHQPDETDDRPSPEGNASPPKSIWNNFLDHEGWGFLHTYTTTRPLRLLYLDGTSAAKTTFGTLDLQDKAILQDRFAFTTNLDDDNIRAAELCRVAREDWQAKVDGFLRMETGFEIIMCEVAEGGLETRGTVATPKIKDTFATYKALAQRFRGIGRGRVVVEYERFVTMHGDDVVDEQRLGELRTEIDDLVMGRDDDDAVQEERVDWQGVTDMIIERFTAPLRLLSSEEEQWESKAAFDNEAGRLLLPFIDHRSRNREAEISRCVTYFQPGHILPPSPSNPNVAASSILHVSSTICRELLAAVEDDSSSSQAVSRIQSLASYLDWSSTWRDCAPGCVGREVCYVPVWPFSLALDGRRRPECVDEAGFYQMAVEEIVAASGMKAGG